MVIRSLEVLLEFEQNTHAIVSSQTAILKDSLVL